MPELVFAGYGEFLQETLLTGDLEGNLGKDDGNVPIRAHSLLAG